LHAATAASWRFGALLNALSWWRACLFAPPICAQAECAAIIGDRPQLCRRAAPKPSSLISVLIEPPRAHPLAWIHRREGRAIAAELRASGEAVHLATFGRRVPVDAGTVLVRVSDPVMPAALAALDAAEIAFCGPGIAALQLCYDKQQAYALAKAHGVECPETRPAMDADTMARPLVLKPRQGSDSLGLRLLRTGAVPRRYAHADYLAQTRVRGQELTVGLLGDAVGMPLHIRLAEGQAYTFWRKYLWPPHKEVLADAQLVLRVRSEAGRIAALFSITWAARIDFIYEAARGCLWFLECDAAPLVGPGSAFARSLAAAGIDRAEQLRRLTTPPFASTARPSRDPTP
jgi:hypothetical protein